MAEKKAFVLRINPDMLKEVELWAADEFRSTNGQIEFLLQEALKARKKNAKKKKDTE
ncbi:Arc family DNA binding domain-containing protein [Mucilaginibacter conchicola]|uniref:Arc family DNA binding domain-containing protein n=1 Tax=Mucilaginibacter conchicola TaxID=2303333 RepID=A0A372NPQ2_9SPHI|nr:Arc family DNA binding domain-containing protein [Mucilaginibacter conchicola]RFZ90919.1 Arc family DNA binding domain-containing protein [Mucilaginibacter conchicola]